MLHPQVAGRSCSDCQKYMYEDRGPIFGKLMMRGDKPVTRGRGDKTPCKFCPKIPAGRPPEPASAVDLSPEHLETLKFYRECKAVGNFPNDPRVRWAASLIKMVEDGIERAAHGRVQSELAQLIGGFVRA